MSEEITGTVALAKMLGAKFKARKIQHEGGKCSIVVDLIDNHTVVWRLIVASHVLNRAELCNPSLPSAEMFVPKAKELYRLAVAGDEGVYAMGYLFEAR